MNLAPWSSPSEGASKVMAIFRNLRLESVMRFNCFATAFLACLFAAVGVELPDGVRRVKALNYPDCFELTNGDTRVTLCHHVGGRVLEYSFKGRNALYLDPPLGRCGMTDAEIRTSGRRALAAKYPMSKVSRAYEKGETQGFIKVSVDAETRQIMGAAILGVGGDEVIHVLLDVMYAKAP